MRDAYDEELRVRIGAIGFGGNTESRDRRVAIDVGVKDVEETVYAIVRMKYDVEQPAFRATTHFRGDVQKRFLHRLAVFDNRDSAWLRGDE